MLLYIAAFTALIVCCDALECFECTNVTKLSDCRTTTVCPSGENCYTERSGLGPATSYNLGCKPLASCHDAPVVGREIRTRRSDCAQCCSVGYCNKQLCSNVPTAVTSGNSSCEDDPDYNCALISGTFNICGDVQNAKQVCRKWCGLCNIVDGAWSEWSQYPACDVTCGDGRQVRSRTCTNPAPSNGGLDCVGPASESKTCHLEPCPVPGGWSQWSDWSGCSQTCGVGLQRRTRTCSNPPPSLYGDHCFGDSLDDKICFDRACVDGVWGQWSAWGNCTAGLKSRSRVCDSPAPSTFGHECPGNNADMALCEDSSGQDTNVSFVVNSPDYNLVNNTPMFQKVLVNAGNLFNPKTGVSTCRVAGLYVFTMRLSGTRKGGYCYIEHNDVTVAYTQVYLGAKILYLFLNIDDTVTLNCGEWRHVYVDTSTSYSGALVHV